MSTFRTPLAVSPLPDGRRWKLVHAFTYGIGSKYSKDQISVPSSFVTDFASIPWFLWRLLFFWMPLWAKYSKASVLHDWLYQNHAFALRTSGGDFRIPIGREFADEIFLEAMLVDWRDHRSGKIIAKIEYYAVRLFGWAAWR